MSETIERALEVAHLAHGNQMYGVYPYEFHLKQTLKIAQKHNLPEEIQVSCILHDTIEDTSLSYSDIKKAFGIEVAEIVYAVTDELGRNRKERKKKTYPKIRKNVGAILVKLCDRIANVRHLALYDSKLYTMYLNEHNHFIDNVVSTRFNKIDDLCLELSLMFKEE